MNKNEFRPNKIQLQFIPYFQKANFQSITISLNYLALPL